MLFIENSFVYGYYLGIAGMLIGLIFGYDYTQKKHFRYTYYTPNYSTDMFRNINLLKNTSDTMLRFDYYKYYTDILHSLFVGWFVGFFIGFLIPIIFNFLLIILVVMLVILIGLYCLKLLGFIVLTNFYPQTQTQTQTHSNKTNKNSIVLNYSIDLDSSTSSTLSTDKPKKKNHILVLDK